MPLNLTSFQVSKSGAFATEFTTQDGHRIQVLIETGGAALEAEAVNFASVYLAREMQVRQQAANQVFAENRYIKDDLEYSTADDLLKALEPGALLISWQWQETRMAYSSPRDDLESCKEKYVILVCYDRRSDELEINLEQASGW